MIDAVPLPATSGGEGPDSYPVDSLEVRPVTTTSNLGWPGSLPEPDRSVRRLGWPEPSAPRVTSPTSASPPVPTRPVEAGTGPGSTHSAPATQVETGEPVPVQPTAPAAGASDAPLTQRLPDVATDALVSRETSPEASRETEVARLEVDPPEGVRHVYAPVVDGDVENGAELDQFERDNPSSTPVDNSVDSGGAAPIFPDVSRETDPREALADVLPRPDDDTPVAQELAENARKRIRLTGQQLPKPPHPRVISVANQKGGVGKTTTTVNLAASLAQGGLAVLVVDLDPQGNASTALGIDHHAEVVSVYDVLVDGRPFAEVVQPCPTVEGLDCAPSTIDLAGAEIELVSLVARESRLHKALRAALDAGVDYDYVLIDCPPSLGLLTVNAMVAADEMLIPIQCEYYALEGLSQLLKNIELVRSHLNPTLHVSTILLTMYDGRTRLSAQVADEVRAHFPEQVLRTTVPRSVRVSEAPSFGETVMTYDPSSSGALAYLEAATELAERARTTPTPASR